MGRKGLAAACATCVCLIHASMSFAADVVLYSTDAINLHGNWALAADASAAGGQFLSSVDNGWSATSNALVSPADYVEFTFSAPAGTPHHVWFRVRASAASKWNDSIWAQFSDAVDVGGAPLYRIGSTAGLLVNGQTCSGCAINGWGWIDGAYWLSQITTVTFATGGLHTLRVQTREDGVQIDQVVLSPSTYLSVAPGATTADYAIVPKPAAVTAFYAAALAIPGTIQAEDFDNGGEGVVYHDTTAGNSGAQYRNTDVDIQAASEGAYNIGWISPGEWLNYTVTVAAAGNYLLEARVAAVASGGSFQVEFGGVNVTGAIGIPNTGGWQNWTTVSKTVTLAAGQQPMRVVFDTGGTNGVGNVNWYRLTAVAAGSTPHGGSPWPLPGTIRAGNFDDGAEGVAYHDTTAGNTGGQYRSGNVDIEVSGEGGYDVGWIANGEWLAYTVTAAAAGNYTLQLRVASMFSSGSVHASVNGSNTTRIAVPNTGGWQTYTNIIVPVTLAAGTQVMRLVFDTGGFNISTITVSAAPPPPVVQSGIINVPAGGDFQSALNNANPGDTILLAAGATYVGNFVLPAKSGTGVITIRSAAPDSSLPGTNARIDPSYSPQLPKLQSTNSSPALMTAAGAHHYTLMALEFPATYQGFYDIIRLGDGSAVQNSLAMVPHDLVVDRCYIHGDVTYGQKRGIALNSASTTIANSYIAEIKAVGQDSQAIGGWNGPGPYTIRNNYLEAAGENVLIGGSDPAIPNLIPSDITVQGNTMSKPLAWRTQSWSVKNIFELKNAQRVVVDGNVFENNWLAAQVGYAVVFTPRNQGGTCPWCNVQQVQFTNNVVRHVSSGINILGTDNLQPSGTLNTITIRNNLFEDVSGSAYGGSGRFMLIGAGAANVTVDHNTVLQDGTSALYGHGASMPGFVFTNNIVPDKSWAIMGDSASPGNGAIAMYFPTGVFKNGIFAGSNPATYPLNNYYPTAYDSVGFVNLTGGNYRLASTSPYHNAAIDGTDAGCNIDAVNAAAKTKY